MPDPDARPSLTVPSTLLSAAHLVARLASPMVYRDLPRPRLGIIADQLSTLSGVMIRNTEGPPLNVPISQVAQHLTRYRAECEHLALLRDISLALAWRPVDPGQTVGYLLALAAHFRQLAGHSSGCERVSPSQQPERPLTEREASWLALLHLAGVTVLRPTMFYPAGDVPDMASTLRMFRTKIIWVARRLDEDPNKLLAQRRRVLADQPGGWAEQVLGNVAMMFRLKDQSYSLALTPQLDLLVLLEHYESGSVMGTG